MTDGKNLPIVRWVKFNLVGGIGIVLQLAVLGLLTGRIRLAALPATAIAVECTLLHNFFWHERFTWRTRARIEQDGVLARLARFQLANGAISLFGNLSVMGALSGVLHVRVLLANGIAIVVCSIVNFFVADRWVFATRAM